MSGVSGIACVLGSAVICVDLILRKCGARKNFQITSSNAFLSASLSLSSGIMLFSSLYSMLPTSKKYLTRAGLSAQASAYSLIGLFLAGVVVIRIVSGFIHRYIPSHVVDCAHTHEPDSDLESGDGEMEEHRHGHIAKGAGDGSTERTPLLQRAPIRASKSTTAAMIERTAEDRTLHGKPPKDPVRRWRRQISALVGGSKALCDENGPCYGVSETCGQECTKTLGRKVSTTSINSTHTLSHPQTLQVPMDPRGPAMNDDPDAPQTVRHISDGWLSAPPRSEGQGADYFYQQSIPAVYERQAPSQSDGDDLPPKSSGSMSSTTFKTFQQPPSSSQHHHHVPQNAFLSIGLQTSLAIALHKLPEGFITFATNHANPTLGLTVFLALFIHNITEGFAMALPLYLALNSRWKAICWSSILGGVSQPAGAGIAALWIWAAHKAGAGGHATLGTSWGVYGGMFAATAGVMTSVALQLFSEGLGLTHNRGLCIGSAIMGMGILGLSFALTA